MSESPQKIDFTLDEYTRVLECLSRKLKGERKTRDLYTEIAAEVFGLEEVPPEVRNRVKRMCFYTMYSYGGGLTGRQIQEENKPG